MKYVAFLRGINLGKRQIKMNDLQKVFIDLGFSSVKTLIASGNVLFETQEENEEKLRETLEKRKPRKKQYKEGEEFLFLGKKYALKLHDGIKIGFKEDKLYFPRASLFRAEKEITNWYIQQAKLFIAKRVKFHADKMDAAYADLLFSDTKSKWGTCFPDNSLQFNWRLIMTPIMVLDYVVIHELIHTTEKNHGNSFWRKVRLYTPAYKQHRKWLNDNAHLLQL